jgi:hypothetical protein
LKATPLTSLQGVITQKPANIIKAKVEMLTSADN